MPDNYTFVGGAADGTRHSVADEISRITMSGDEYRKIFMDNAIAVFVVVGVPVRQMLQMLVDKYPEP